MPPAAPAREWIAESLGIVKEPVTEMKEMVMAAFREVVI